MRVISQFFFVSILGVVLAACGGDSGGGSGAPILSDNSRLADLSISAAEFDQLFQTTQPDYTATVSFLRATTTVTALTDNSAATISVDGVQATSGTASARITLDDGVNSIAVVVTAEDGVTTSTYTIEITRQTAASFAQQAYIKASNTGSFDLFGTTAAMSGDTLALGAPSEDSSATGVGGDQNDNAAENAGAVYVFVRDPAGVWSQQAYIKASNTGAGDGFGSSLALDGDTLVVGAGSEGSAATGIDGDQTDNSAARSGAAYVFTRDVASDWSQQAYIKASNTAGGDNFGSAITLSGDTLAVGAPRENSAATGIDGDQNDNSLAIAGAVYVFTRDVAGAWSQQAYVKASNTGEIDAFGASVALSGDTLAVGAMFEDSRATGINGDQASNNAEFAGAAYVFTRDGASVWTQQAYIKASNTAEADQFGIALALSGDTLAVGADSEDSNASGIDGSGSNDDAPLSGAVYLFGRDAAGVWTQEAYVKASNTDAGDRFGSSLALSSSALAIGALHEQSASLGIDGDESDNSAGSTGAVYLFTRGSMGAWTQQAYVKASNTGPGDTFGKTVALSGSLLAVTAHNEASDAAGIEGEQSNDNAPESGAVYVFR